ncbi:hypothetical protein EWB00_000856 [Schistosoma japonicum]|uniref:Uncharacterized protein n=1 Tax=Schistosoma japonicum TaxID=6182 RepID=A0A4Z2CK52_SCHJA|nr:hypothetical protein EWB00_000856 [Schistosoma japonicum]
MALDGAAAIFCSHQQWLKLEVLVRVGHQGFTVSGGSDDHTPQPSLHGQHSTVLPESAHANPGQKDRELIDTPGVGNQDGPVDGDKDKCCVSVAL